VLLYYCVITKSSTAMKKKAKIYEDFLRRNKGHDAVEEPDQDWKGNSPREPLNTSHEFFNQNDFLKEILKDDIAEGM